MAADSPPTDGEIPERLRSPQTAAERRERDRMLYQLRGQSSLTWTRLAEMFGLSERSCYRIVNRYRERVALDVLDEQVAREVVRDTLDGLDDTLERLTIIASQPDEPGNVKVGALRARMDAYRQRVELLARMGAVDVAQIRVELDLEQAAQRLLEVFDRFELPAEVRQAAIEAIDRPALGAGDDGDDGEMVDAEVVG